MLKILGIFYSKSARSYIWVSLLLLLLLFSLLKVLSFSTLVISINSVTQKSLFEFLRYFVVSVLSLVILNPQMEFWYINRVKYKEMCRLEELLDIHNIRDKVDGVPSLVHSNITLEELDLQDFKFTSLCCLIFILFQAFILPLFFFIMNIYGMTGFTLFPLLAIAFLFVLLYGFVFIYNKRIIKELIDTEKTCLLWEIEARFFLDYFHISYDEDEIDYNNDDDYEYRDF